MNSLKVSIGVVFVLSLGFTPFVVGDEDKPITDTGFATKVAQDNLSEIELAKLAQTHSTNPDIKKFADKMIEDHTKANNDLKPIAKQLKIQLPSEIPDKCKKTCEHLKSLKGLEFDKAYISHMVKDHDKDTAMVERATKELNNPTLKDYAGQILPVIKKHDAMAKKLNDSVNK